MAASSCRLICLPIHFRTAPNITKSLLLSRFISRNSSQRGFGSSKQLIGSRTDFQYAIECNRCNSVLSMQSRLAAPAAIQTSKRPYSSEAEGGGRNSGQRMKPVFVAIPNPFKVIRNKMYFWMIRSYFDAEFRAEDFISGAKQALCTISDCIAEGNFDHLDGLLSKKLQDEVKETCRGLALRDRTNILVTMDDVLHVFPQNVAVHYDDSGGKFLNILMRFWCHSMASEESDKGVVGLRIGKPPPGMSEEEFQNMGSVISCTYEFHRDFSTGVDPRWVVTYIQHGKWLNTEARWLPKEWT